MAQQTTSRTVLIFSRPIQVLHGDEHNHAQRYKNSSKLMSVFITFFLKATKFTDKIHRNGDWNNFFGLHQVLHNALFSILSAVFAQVLQVAQEHFQLAHLAEEPIFCYGLFAVYFTQNFTSFRKNTKKKKGEEVKRCNCFVFSGKRGIRTPESVSPITRFPGVPLQPLEHLSF